MTEDRDKGGAQGPAWQLLAEFSLPNDPGSEDRAMELVTEVVHELTLPAAHLEQMQRILTDAVRNAIQRSGSYQPGSSVVIRAFVLSGALEALTQGAAADEPREQIAEHSAQEAGKSGPLPVRGWGYFLIDKMIDGPSDLGTLPRRAVELYLYPEGGERGAKPTRLSPPE